MENLERIIAKIGEEKKKKAKFILDDANKQSEDILEKAENRAKVSINNLEKEWASKKALELERIKSSIALKCRNIILEAKQESISFVFDKVNELLTKLTHEQMTEYIQKTLNGRVLASDEHLIIPKAYEGINLPIQYSLSEDIKTGFLIEKNGIYENYTLEALIQVNKDELESQIQSKVFF